MRILALADLHGSHKALKKLKKTAKKADIVVIAGDFTIFGGHMEKFLKTFNSLNKKVLLITGNHENVGEVKRYCTKLDNVYFMNNKIMRVNGLLFYGYDTNGFSHIDKRFEKDSKKFVKAIKVEAKKLEKLNKKNKKKSLKKITEKQLKTILISHAPPYGTKADKIMDEHCGNKSVRNFLAKYKIDYCFCGHIHDAERTVDKYKKTVVVNSGPYGMMFEI